MTIMKITRYLTGLIVIATLTLAIASPARGDDVKPLDSPIHMTILPVPDALRNAQETPVAASVTQNTSAAANAPAMPDSVQYGANRDDSDADLAHGGRR